MEEGFSLQKQHLAAILDFLLFKFFKFIKMSRRGPKIVYPDHPLIQLLGPPAPESIPDLRDYNIPLDYGKKTTSFLDTCTGRNCVVDICTGR